MMANEHFVLCGGVTGSRETETPALRLDLSGPDENVHLRISDISKRLLANLPDTYLDLLEIASYVYAADSAITRGGSTDARMGARWRRRFRFVIPVRQQTLWSSDAVSSALTEMLGFLSDDSYSFEFKSGPTLPQFERYFEYPEGDRSEFAPDEVILFSGGLDSLAGAVETLNAEGKSVTLVSHRSANTIANTQTELSSRLQKRFGDDQVLHVPVRVDLKRGLSREATHRTRSFLFAALGAVTARLFGKDRLHFFENGVVSLNLPPAAQVVGSRATRTTHPQTLTGFRRLLTAAFRQPFEVDNPYAWMTKAEIVAKISANGCGDLIRHSRSCANVRAITKLNPHCGRCSQCIDRRFGILAAGQAHEDPQDAYAIDLFTGERRAGSDREMALAYVRTASKLNRMADIAFFSKYGEVSRVVQHFPESSNVVAGRIFDLHQRHASAVCHVIEDAIKSHAAALRRGELSANSLLVLTVGKNTPEASYPEPRIITKPPNVPISDIRLAIDEEGKRVVFDGWGEITGVGAQLLAALAIPFRDALSAERAPENYPFIDTQQLQKTTGCDSDELFRNRVRRCRRLIEGLAATAGDMPPTTDAVIENKQWSGYRLNPDRIRLVAISELRASK